MKGQIRLGGRKLTVAGRPPSGQPDFFFRVGVLENGGQTRRIFASLLLSEISDFPGIRLGVRRHSCRGVNGDPGRERTGKRKGGALLWPPFVALRIQRESGLPIPARKEVTRSTRKAFSDEWWT